MVGIYRILSPSGKAYIGQSWNIAERWSNYRRNHKNQRVIARSFAKYGIDAHIFEVILELSEDVSQEILDRWEQFYMDQYRACGIELLNIREAGANGKHHPETIRRIRESQIGKIISPEAIAKKKISYSINGKTRGHKNINAKLTDAKVIEIREKYIPGIYGVEVLAEEYGLSGATISDILNRKIWKHLPMLECEKNRPKIKKLKATGSKNHQAKLDEGKVREIRSKFIPHVYTKSMLCKEYGISRSVIKNVLSGKIWKHVV